MENQLVPIKIVTRASGEVVKVVVRTIDGENFEDDERFWLSLQEVEDPAGSADGWDGYWRSGGDEGLILSSSMIDEEKMGPAGYLKI